MATLELGKPDTIDPQKHTEITEIQLRPLKLKNE